MENRKCPNCNAQLELSKSKTTYECPYCGSKFDIEAEAKERFLKKSNDFDENIFIIERDFSTSRQKKQTGRCIDTIIYCINELGTSEKVENYMRKGLISGSDTAAEGINDSLIDNVKTRINNELEVGERIILYKDMGIFSKGKEFTVVTDKRCMFFTKKKCTSAYHKDITTLRLSDSGDCPAWYINADLDKRIPAMEPSGQLTGATVALACLIGFEQQPERERIRLI